MKLLEIITVGDYKFEHYLVEDYTYIVPKVGCVFSWIKGNPGEEHYKAYAYLLDDLVEIVGISQISLNDAATRACLFAVEEI
jgi:hypothetical protein